MPPILLPAAIWALTCLATALRGLAAWRTRAVADAADRAAWMAEAQGLFAAMRDRMRAGDKAGADALEPQATAAWMAALGRGRRR